MTVADKTGKGEERKGGGSSSPPYVSYKTFKNFLDSLKIAMPGRIDRSVLHTMSGAVQSHLMHALRTMELVNAHEIPSESFKRLAASDGPGRQQALIAALKIGYPFLFDGSIDLGTASGKQLLDEFGKTALNGDSVRKSVAFFLAGAKDAGIKLSPYFSKIQSRSVPKKSNGSGMSSAKADPEPKTKSVPVTPPAETGTRGVESPQYAQATTPSAQESLLLWGLFHRLPKPGTPWPKAQREQWIQTLQNVLTMEYPGE